MTGTRSLEVRQLTICRLTAIAHVWFDAGRERVRIGAEFFHCGRGANMSQPMDDSAA